MAEQLVEHPGNVVAGDVLQHIGADDAVVGGLDRAGKGLVAGIVAGDLHVAPIRQRLEARVCRLAGVGGVGLRLARAVVEEGSGDRKSTRLNSSNSCANRMPYSGWKTKQT